MEKAKTNVINKDKMKLLMFVCITVLMISFLLVYCKGKFVGYGLGKDAVDAVAMENRVIYKADIDVETGSISEILLQVGTYGRLNKGKLFVDFYENEKKIHSWICDTDTLKDNLYHTFSFDKTYKVSKENKYYLTLKEEYEDSNEIALWIDKSKDTTSSDGANQVLLKDSLCYKIGYSKNLTRDIVNVCIIFMVICLFGMTLANASDLVIMSFIIGLLGIFYFFATPLFFI